MQRVWYAKPNLIFSQRTTQFDEELKRVSVRQGNIQHVVTLMAGDRHADADFWNAYNRVENHRLPISEPTTVDV